MATSPFQRAPDSLGATTNPREFFLRVRRALDPIVNLLNALAEQGIIIIGSDGEWHIDPGKFGLPTGWAMTLVEGEAGEDGPPGPPGPQGPAGISSPGVAGQPGPPLISWRVASKKRAKMRPGGNEATEILLNA